MGRTTRSLQFNGLPVARISPTADAIHRLSVPEPEVSLCTSDGYRVTAVTSIDIRMLEDDNHPYKLASTGLRPTELPHDR